jgi:Ca2+-binding EF-hand superfamily protein
MGGSGRHGGRGGFAGGPGGPGMAGGYREPSREVLLRRFDADGDGKITRDEFDRVLKSDFALADKDGNGVLSPLEVRAVNERLLTQKDVSPIIDWNGDGNVSLEEFGAQWRALFERADADHDGVVTEEELTRTGAPQGGPGGGESGGRGGHHGGGPGGGPPGGGGN